MEKEYYIVRLSSDEYVKSFYNGDYPVLKITKDIYHARGLKNLDAAVRLYENVAEYLKKYPEPGENNHIQLMKVKISTEEIEI